MAVATQTKQSTKGKSSKKAAPVAEEKTNDNSLINVVNLSINQISVSEFSPQWHRRRRFKQEDLIELAESIKQQGLINPITVRQRDWQPHLTEFGKYGAMLHAGRPDWLLQHIGKETEKEAQVWCDANRYEIVAGERRFEATKLAGLSSIPVFIKDLSDEQALEIQLQENLQRVDVDPLDEAFSYKFLMDEKKMTVQDLMVKFAKTEKYITLRLKLNLLVPEVLKDLADGFLPLGHAIEISKLSSEAQPEALTLCYETVWQNGADVPDKSTPQSLAQLRSDIQSDIFLSLKDARFPLKNTNLRDDGLPCTKCPERTGAKGSLFEEMHDPKNDRCLNGTCYNQKTTRFIQITREETSAALVASGEAAEGYKMPIIAWMPNNRPSVEQLFGERPLVDGEYSHIKHSGDCEKKEPGIFVDKSGGRFGEVIQICRSAECSVHRRNTSSSNSSVATAPGEKSDTEKRAFYERKQEIFDIKVAEPVRLKVLTEAAQNFTGEKWVFEDDAWRMRLIVRMWNRIDSQAREVITKVLGREKYSISPGSSEKAQIKYFSEKFTADELSKILFLSIIANEDEMLYGNWRDQSGVEEVAKEFNVNYALLDAQERVAVAPKKYKDAATEHLGKVERGEAKKRPVFYKLEK